MTELISQSIAVGSLKKQKGHSYLISLRKPKPGAERALSVTVAGPPSVLDYFLSHQLTSSISLSPWQNQPQPCQTPWAPAWASQSIPVNLGRNLAHTGGYQPMLIPLGLTNNRMHRTSTWHREPSAVLRDTAARERSLKLHAANPSCRSEKLKIFSLRFQP